MKVTKMHGLGNDFIILDNLHGNLVNLSDLARLMCRRRFHIGADGILVLEPSSKAHLRMRVYNPDGSEAEMCGNGIRCFAKYAYDRKILSTREMEIETGAGIIKPVIVDSPADSVDTLVRVDMGKPQLRRGQIPMLGDDSSQVVNEVLKTREKEFEFSAVSMGNPHCIIFVDTLDDDPVLNYGSEIENHPIFPAKTNVEFVRVDDRSHIAVNVWERGAGRTLACGTGACASVVAGVLRGVVDRNVTVSLPGGDLRIEWDKDTGNIFMTGPAVEVFTGEVILKEIGG